MRVLAVFRASFLEQLRDWWSLVLGLTTPSFFVLLYYLMTAGGSTTYAVLVMNHDQPVQLGDGQSLAAGADVIAAIRATTYPDGSPMLRVTEVSDRAAADRKLADRDAAVLVVLPGQLSAELAGKHTGEPQPYTLVGDLTNPQYMIAAVFASVGVDSVVRAITGEKSRVPMAEEALGASGARSEFETFVPGLFNIAIVLLVFTVAMAVAREVEAGTLRRLKLSRMTAFDFLSGVSAVQIVVGVCGLLCTFGTATAFGFHSRGSLLVAVVVGVLGSFSVVGVGLIVACFARTVRKAFLVANLPFMLLMFFSGSIYPLPKVALFHVGERAIGLWDMLPPTHAVVAFNKIMTLGAGFGDVLYELGALALLSALFFATGVFLFRRMHMAAQ